MLDAVLIVTDNNYSDSNSRVEITLLIDSCCCVIL